MDESYKTLEEYGKHATPGRRVYVLSKNKTTKVYGTAGNGYSADGILRLIKTDAGDILEVTEESVSYVFFVTLN